MIEKYESRLYVWAREKQLLASVNGRTAGTGSGSSQVRAGEGAGLHSLSGSGTRSITASGA